MKKTLPTFPTDEAAEEFLATADLSEYDLSGMKPHNFKVLQEPLQEGATRSRKSYYIDELPDKDEWIEALQNATFDHLDPSFDHLVENAADTRKSYYAHELPDEVVEALKNADYGHIDPELEKLMDEDSEEKV